MEAILPGRECDTQNRSLTLWEVRRKETHWSGICCLRQCSTTTSSYAQKRRPTLNKELWAVKNMLAILQSLFAWKSMKLITKKNERWRKINAWSIYWLLPQNYLLLLLYKNRRMSQSRLFFSPLLNKPRILFLLLQRFHLTSTSKLKHLFFHFEPLPLVLS